MSPLRKKEEKEEEEATRERLRRILHRRAAWHSCVRFRIIIAFANSLMTLSLSLSHSPIIFGGGRESVTLDYNDHRHISIDPEMLRAEIRKKGNRNTVRALLFSN